MDKRSETDSDFEEKDSWAENLEVMDFSGMSDINEHEDICDHFENRTLNESVLEIRGKNLSSDCQEQLGFWDPLDRLNFEEESKADADLYIEEITRRVNENNGIISITNLHSI